MIYIPNYQLLYVRVPKTGSTSFSTFLIDNFNNENNIIANVAYNNNIRLNTNINEAHKYLYHMTLQYVYNNNILSPNDLDASKKFGFIRNPLERILSHYFHITNKSFFLKEESIEGPSPEDFQKRIIKNNGFFLLDKLSKDLKSYQSQVNYLQSNYLEIDGKIKGIFFPYEYLELISEQLLNLSKLKIPIKRINTSIISKPIAELINDYYDLKSLKLIKKVHAMDFVLYEESFNNKSIF